MIDRHLWLSILICSSMTKKKLIVILLAICSFALVLRLINQNYPPLLWDEAALGYNAYSILKTGRDEYGQLLPLIFKSFGDYKPGFYVYLALPFVALFGLNPLSVRLPSILAGALLPLLLYLLVNKLFHRPKLALVTAAFTAITPYAIHFSRQAWETNILTCLLVLGCYLLQSALSSGKKKLYFLSSVIFLTSLYTYQTAKLVSPLLVLSLLFLNFDLVKKHLKTIILFFLLPLAIGCSPLAYGLTSSASNRLQVVSLFSYPQTAAEIATLKAESPGLDYPLFHSQFFYFAQIFLNHYFNYFSPQFLATQGDWQNPRSSAPYTGVLLLPQYFFFIIGLLALFYPKPKNKSAYLFFFWLLISPLAGALTRDTIQSVRAMSFVVPLIFFSAYGFYATLAFLKNNYSSIVLPFSLLTLVFCLANLYYFYDLYLVHMVKKSPTDWLYGYESAAKYVAAHQNQYQHVYFANSYGQAYIYYLFFTEYSPQKYQSQANLSVTGLDTGVVDHIDKIQFTSPNFQSLKNQPSTLAIVTQDDINRQALTAADQALLKPLSPIGGTNLFYVYQKP